MAYSCVGPAWSWAWIGNRAWGDLFVSPQEPSNERPVGLGPGLPAGRHRRPLLQHGVSMVARLFRRGWFWELAGKLMSYGANILMFIVRPVSMQDNFSTVGTGVVASLAQPG